MKHYPIFFGPYGVLVAGKGFIARVLVRGRCLLEETGESFFSVLGVNPGAVAGDGANMGEAYHDFLANLRALLFAIADQAPDFHGFEEQVRRLVQDTNRPNARYWSDAVAKVRAGEIDLEGVRREDAESEVGVTFELVAVKGQPSPDFRPELNETAATRDVFGVAA